MSASRSPPDPSPAALPDGAWDEFANTFREWHYLAGGAAATAAVVLAAAFHLANRYLDVLEAREGGDGA